MTASLIEQRLNKLEKSVRFYKQISFLFIAVIGILVFMSFDRKKTPVDDVVKAKEFQVVDDYGKVFLSMKKDENAGQVDLYNSYGTKILTLTSSDGGAGTVIGRDAGGRKIYRLINVKGGGGSIDVYNTNEVMADELTITDRNTGYLEVNNSDGNQMLVCTYGSSSSSGIFSVYNNMNTRICVLGSDNNSNGVLNVYNRSGGSMNGVWPKE